MATPVPAPSAAESVDPSALWAEPVAHTASPEYQRWLGPPRAARVGAALALTLATALLPVLGPWCWAFADRELRAIERRKASPRGRRWIAAAHTIGIGATFLTVTAFAFIVSYAAFRI
jgi:hypothetical protein